MAHYLDSSVVLNYLLGQTKAKLDLSQEGVFLSSVLLKVECLRTLDRFRLQRTFSENILSEHYESLYRLLAGCTLIPLDEKVLDRASQPLPTTLGSLDAIHLASALLWQEHTQTQITIATHDLQLGKAATSMGFDVIGINH